MEEVKAFKFQVEVHGINVTITPLEGSQGMNDHIDALIYGLAALMRHLIDSGASAEEISACSQHLVEVMLASPNPTNPYKAP